MLITLYFLMHCFDTPCLTNAQLTKKPNFVGFLVIIIVFDWLMLLVGLAYEREWFEITKTSKKQNPNRWPMLVGFVFLAAAFVPHYYTINKTSTPEGVALFVVTLVLWAVYGVVAMVWVGTGSDDVMNKNAAYKNAAYNILDIFSKNAVGVVISILTFTFSSAHGAC